MNAGITAVCILYVIIGALLLSVLLKTRTKKQLITACFIAAGVLWYTFSLHFFLPNLMGWPVDQEIPDGAKVISVQVQEPAKGDPGAFYFWCSVLPDWQTDSIYVFINWLMIENYIKDCWKPRKNKKRLAAAGCRLNVAKRKRAGTVKVRPKWSVLNLKL
jgi:hypothetical protein